MEEEKEGEEKKTRLNFSRAEKSVVSSLSINFSFSFFSSVFLTFKLFPLKRRKWGTKDEDDGGENEDERREQKKKKRRPQILKKIDYAY